MRGSDKESANCSPYFSALQYINNLETQTYSCQVFCRLFQVYFVFVLTFHSRLEPCYDQFIDQG